ncbi:ABC transporter ATP-binding protein [Actinomadura luteofluorescens]|uniref:ABC transporter ATP-binding protein n=1 Tax=Actinomadura luteofluorescens TaxID=46163 RepID=UPI00362BBF31
MTHTDEPGDIVLSAEGVSAGYGARSRNVLHDVSVAIDRGRTMGVVGESGSGKSTLARVLVGQLAPARGVVRLDGADVHRLPRKERFAARRRVQLVPQDPYSSLDPRMPVGRALAEAIDPRGRLRTGAHRDRIAELLESVALDASAARRLPHEFSGGQRQRIVIARALAAEPRVVIADEVTSSLDTSVQAEILELLLDLQRRLGLTYVFITHDLAVAQYMCTDLSVLYLGTLVEQGASDVLSRPGHPYTELLRDSRPDPSGRSLTEPCAGSRARTSPTRRIRRPGACSTPAAGTGRGPTGTAAAARRSRRPPGRRTARAQDGVPLPDRAASEDLASQNPAEDGRGE